MATKVYVNGKTLTRPGVYAFTRSGVKTVPASLPFGHVAILDSGIGAGYGGGEGNVVYDFTTLQDFQNFVKGGPLFDIAARLFSPLRGVKGATKVSLVQARDVTAANTVVNLTNVDFTLTTLDKGLNANGDLGGGTVLVKGYAVKIIGKGTDTIKLQLLHGTSTGIDSVSAAPYDNNYDPKPALLAETPWCTNGNQLVSYIQTNPAFVKGVVVSGITITGGGTFVAGDISANVTPILFGGATESYSVGAYASGLTLLGDLKNDFILATEFGTDAESSKNKDLVAIADNAKYGKYVVIGGGKTAPELATISIAAAKNYNSEKVIIVHGDGEIAVNSGYKKISVLSKAAAILGRICGIDPENPMTLKKVGIDKETNALSEQQLTDALEAGVTVTYNDDELGYVVCQQAVNTLQNNSSLITQDARSHDVGVERIKTQVNKEAAIYLKKKFYGSEEGANRLTLNPEDVISAVDGFLNGKVKDGLIVRYANITVGIEGDVYMINYEFVPNYPVNKIIITGTILDK